MRGAVAAVLDARLLPGAAIVLAVVVAAVVSGDGILTTGLTLDASARRAVRAGGAVAIVLGILGLALQRRRIRAMDPRGGDPSAAGLAIAAGLILGLALVGLLNPPGSLARPDVGPAPGGGPRFGQGESLAGNPQSDLTDGGGSLGRGERMESEMLPGVENAGEEEPALRRLGRRTAGTLLLLLLALAMWRLLARTLDLGASGADAVEPDDEPDEGPGIPPPPDHLATLRRRLSELRAEGVPPSRTVQLAYEALLAALAAVGVPREAREAPHEHLRRTLGDLGLAGAPPHLLARLHVADRFGPRPVTEEDGRAARGALEHVLTDLTDRLEPTGPGGGPSAPDATTPDAAR